MPLRRLSCKRVVPVCRVFYGRYWARTSDPQLVDSEQRAARFVAAGSKPPRSRKTCVVGALHGKEGVGGSSPPEGFAKAPQISAFPSALTCTISSMRYLWSPQVQSVLQTSEIDAFAGTTVSAALSCHPSARPQAWFERDWYVAYKESSSRPEWRRRAAPSSGVPAFPAAPGRRSSLPRVRDGRDADPPLPPRR
jgi:hypothetical protein